MMNEIQDKIGPGFHGYVEPFMNIEYYERLGTAPQEEIGGKTSKGVALALHQPWEDPGADPILYAVWKGENDDRIWWTACLGEVPRPW
jgi:hypothetical protein